ncbi:lipocalin family protein [uncultured Psychroserpens sp.]|uniref:lipocalin family protein n=1 Tax=uncultured Psychroserpens sp. TaxID=255436 RepID=UPI0026326589|nr:lipocalin family protein [uncultured Psychroserpens sp.]
MKYLIILLALASFLSCIDDKKPPFNLPQSPKTLIAGDSAKSWKLARRFNNKTRMNMGDCFLSYRVTYLTNGYMHDNNAEQENCGETLTADWIIYHSKDNYPYIKLKSEKLKKLMHLDKDYKFFKILDLNENLMVLEFRHKQFSSKESTIVDFLVPEDVSIDDREFHW